ncbi:MAG: MBL fold metallo-hydrolase [Variovorax sp.]|nr:MAG: MBL fold metallo-hydrolase [Variovorax sp.]
MKIRVYQSDKGDCLRIVGSAGGAILVDGGMRDAFATHVRPDLAKMARRGEAIDLVYVSHIDQDHISGVLELLDDTLAWRVFDFRKGNGVAVKAPAFPRVPAIGAIWHNAFSTVLGENAGAVENLLAQSSKLLSLSADPSWLALAGAHHELAFSVNEAIQLSRRIAADQLGIPLNAPFGGKLAMVRTPPGPEARIAGMNIEVIGPFAEDLENLKDEWNDWLRANAAALARLRAAAAADARSIGNTQGGSAAFLETALKRLGDRGKVTAPNLASLMLLVEEAGKRVLLPGDGHADDILAGLDAQGRLDGNGRLHAAVLKVQHHGSENNITRDFCQRFSADHYIFCGNGKHENPDLDAIDLLLSTNRAERPGARFKLWFNCASTQAPEGAARRHMKAVENRVARHVRGSGGKISARFLTASFFDVAV